jgi:uncharacterized protein (TIGR03084 family)
VQLDEVLADLWAETAELDRLVGGLAADEWATPTPAEGWTIAHQIAHLAWTDEATHLAATDPDAFKASLQTAAANPTGYVDEGAAETAALPPDQLMTYWRETRADVTDALKKVPAGEKVAWYGPPMSPTSMATARLMETWAHGQDVADALGVTRVPTTRLRHVARLGVLAFPYGFAMRGLPIPDRRVRVELTAPDGTAWTLGEGDDRVRGPMLDFCLVVTQRGNLADTTLEVTGETARAWMATAQAFAGPPGKGRAPGSR